MRRVLPVSAVLVMLLAVVPGTAAAQGGMGAPDFKDRFTDEFVEENFCDTGVSVDVVASGVFNVWGLEGEDTFKVTNRFRQALTYRGTTVFFLLAGRLDVQRVEGEFPGPRTDLAVDTGLRSFLRVPGEGAVTLDHGYLEYLVTFDENGEFVDVEVLKDAGGHPDFYEPVFCEAAVAALGIPMP